MVIVLRVMRARAGWDDSGIVVIFASGLLKSHAKAHGMIMCCSNEAMAFVVRCKFFL